MRYAWDPSFRGAVLGAWECGVAAIATVQYLAQLDPLVQPALLSNVGSFVVLRVAVEDAWLIAREFAPEVEEQGSTETP